MEVWCKKTYFGFYSVIILHVPRKVSLQTCSTSDKLQILISNYLNNSVNLHPQISSMMCLVQKNSKTDKTAIIYLKKNVLCNNLKMISPLKRQYLHRFIIDKTFIRKFNETKYRYCKYLKPNSLCYQCESSQHLLILTQCVLAEIIYTKLLSIKSKNLFVQFQQLPENISSTVKHITCVK